MDADATSNYTTIRSSLLSVFLTTFLSSNAAVANTTSIDFDSLTQSPCSEDSCDPLPVTDQYSALGVTFVGAALWAADTNLPLPPYIVSPYNALSDFYGPSMQIQFSGKLPTAVSMYISAINQDSVFLTAYGNSGQVASAITDGWRGTEETSTPYHDQQFVVLSSYEGISQINLATLFDRRGTLIIDNLEFNSVASVPLPGGLPLLASVLGCLSLIGKAHRKK